MINRFKLSMKLALAIAVPIAGILFIMLGTFNSVKISKGYSDEGIDRFSLAVIAKNMQIDIIQVQQWLTDISATRGLDGLDDGFSEAENSKVSFLKDLEQLQGKFTSYGYDKGVQEIELARARFDQYYEAGKEMAAAYVEGGPAAGNKMMANFDAAAAGIAEALEPLISYSVQSGEESINEIGNSLNSLTRTSLIIAGFVLMLSLAMGTLITLAITKPIGLVVNQLRSGASRADQAAQKVAGASQALAEGVSKQAASIEETAASLEEIDSMTKQNASHATEAAAVSQKTKVVVDEADSAMQGVNESMKEISEASNEISKIIKTIDEIAFQTNLLALNAAVEAARAGEAGAGFAVVADEVRNLALRSAEAASSTADLIEQTVDKIQSGSTIVKSSTEKFEEVTRSIVQVDTLIGEIAIASGEQSKGVAAVNSSVHVLDNALQESAQMAEGTSDAASILDSLGQQTASQIDLLTHIVDGGSGANYNAMIAQQKALAASGGQTLLSDQEAQNCWEYSGCGREEGGVMAAKQGVCPAYPSHGRSCANVANTFCNGEEQGNFAQKLAGCKQCDFYQSENYQRTITL